MMDYLKSQNTKYKHTMLNKLMIICPLMTIVFAFLVNPLMFSWATFYWWYAFILYGVIGIFVLLSERIEERSGNRMNTFTLPIDLKKIKIANSLILVGKLLIMEMVLVFLMILVVDVIFFKNSFVSFDILLISICKWLIANTVIVLTNMWQIPFCFLLMRFIGKYLTIAVNLIIGVIFVPLFCNKVFWILNPYCWCAKNMSGLLKIMPNGSLMDTPQPLGLLNIVAILLAITFFVVLLRVDALLYEKETRK